MSPVQGKADMAIQLHFALFNGCNGYLLKPPEMREGASIGPGAIAESVREARASAAAEDPPTSGAGIDSDGSLYWPPPRPELHRASLQLMSLHNLPKVRL